MNIEQFQQAIEQLFGAELLREFDEDYGFTNISNTAISKIGYSTNLSIEVIEKAAEEQVDLLITHHDAWDFIFGLREACVEKLKHYNISHFWIHGPLDYIDFGTSTSLMNVVGIDHVVSHSTYNEGDIPGIGTFQEGIEFNVLVDRMRKTLKEPVRAWKNNDSNVKKVGV